MRKLFKAIWNDPPDLGLIVYIGIVLVVIAAIVGFFIFSAYNASISTEEMEKVRKMSNESEYVR